MLSAVRWNRPESLAAAMSGTGVSLDFIRGPIEWLPTHRSYAVRRSQPVKLRGGPSENPVLLFVAQGLPARISLQDALTGPAVRSDSVTRGWSEGDLGVRVLANSVFLLSLPPSSRSR